MSKTQARKEKNKRHHKRWLKKHPEVVIKSLEKWVSREKDPIRLELAKKRLEEHRRALDKHRPLTDN